MAEEIAGIVDDGATRRVVPVLGKGSLQNITDLKYLRGIDLAIVPADALEYAREQRLFPGIEDSLTYIAKLYNQELHLLARSDIKKIADLSGQTVNVDVQGSSTAFTTTRLFDLLHINAKITNDNPDAALQKLRNGEIAALAFVAAKPAPFFQAIDAADGLHLLDIPLTPAVAGAYVPSRITAADYPRLVASEQPTDTIAVGTVLVAADCETSPTVTATLPISSTRCSRTFKGCLRRVIIRNGGRSISPRSFRAGCVTLRHGNGCSGMRLLRQMSPRIVASPLSRFIDERRQAAAAPRCRMRKRRPFSGNSAHGRTDSPLIDGIGRTRGRASRPRICHESKNSGSDRSYPTRSCPRFRLMRPARRATASAGWPS